MIETRARQRRRAATAVIAAAAVVGAAVPAAADPDGPSAAAEEWTVVSPGGDVTVTLDLDDAGALSYSTERHGEEVLAPAPLGLTLTDADLTSGLELVGRADRVVDETYELLTGKASSSRDHATESTFSFEGEGGDTLELVVRAYDDAAAFRYVLPGEGQGEITDELTEFRVPDGATGWLQPYRNNYEGFYDELAVSDVPAGRELGLPMTVEQASGSWMLLSEAAVDETFAVSRLTSGGDGRFALTLPEDSVSSTLPWQTPWRLAMFGDDAAEVVESTRIFDLNPPSRIEDTSWIEPGRVAWSWWSNAGSPRDEARQREFVDFASEMDWEYVLVDEGWSAEWVPRLVEYAAERDVEILLWSHWTGLDTEAERTEKLPLWKSWGVAGIKVDFMDSDTQERMGFYQTVLEATAEHQLLLNYHGSTSQQGWARTWPHLMTMEGVWGAEQYWGSWRASHNVDLVFTRNVTGSMDYTPVVFSTGNRQTTLAHELATGIVFESALQHLADSPESYRENAAALPLLAALPTTWDQTELVQGRPGEHAVVARRSGEEWYLGVISGTDAMRGQVTLDMLGEGDYVADVYRDGLDDDGAPTITATSGLVDAGTVLPLGLGENGGLAARLRPATAEESAELPALALPPQVVVTAPAADAVVTAGSDVTLTAEAEDVDGEVARVDFVVDGETVASVDTAPFTATWTDPGVGLHSVVAVATDDADDVGYSGPVSFWVEPGSAVLCPVEEASDDFTGDTLDRDRWRVVNEVPEDLRVEDGALRIDTRSGDLYAGGEAKNIVLQDLPEGGWQATARITADLNAGYQQAGLVIYEDRGNYISVNLNARSGSERRFQFVREDNGSPRYTNDDWFTVPSDFPDTYSVRLTSDGETVTASYSADGETFRPFGRPADLTYLEDAGLGLIAVSGGNATHTTEAVFESFELAAQCPELTEVTPAPVTFTDGPGTAQDSYTVPEVEGVEYVLGGAVVGAGTYPGVGTVNLRARAAEGFVLAEDAVAEWSFTFTTTGGQPAPPTPPSLEHGFFLSNDWQGRTAHAFQYGRSTDEVFVGDWDGDGTDSIAVRRGSEFHVSNAPRGGKADRVFAYGRPGDTVLVGDWDGDGQDTFAVRRGSVYHVKNSLAGGPADAVVGYGRPADAVLVGDWDGDGRDTLTVRRGAVYHVKNSMTGGAADRVVAYGRAGDITLAGDWDGDGRDTFAVRRGNVYYAKNSLTGGQADRVVAYGRAGDEVFTGDWDGNGTDTLGLRRLP
ncbi:glycoside hydrolase family 97 catalytic domain-containing protein [Georgenia phoenicis]|uniref:glycoside hydrolase family 97 catalytic domain-containing protein n=1 Tax=unclassified Georgenia TaxID=2626815 RepID=UPI0039AEF5ED